MKPYYRNAAFRAPKTLEEIHPLGKCPTILAEWKDGRSKIITETGVIHNFLIKTFDTQKKFGSAELFEEIDIDFYTQFAEGSLQPPATTHLIMFMVETRSPWFAKPLSSLVCGQVKKMWSIPETTKCVKYLEDVLSKVEENSDGELYFVGKRLTGADIMLHWHIYNVILNRDEMWGGEFTEAKYPFLAKWAKQITQRPAYKRTVQKEADLIAAHKTTAANL